MDEETQKQHRNEASKTKRQPPLFRHMFVFVVVFPNGVVVCYGIGTCGGKPYGRRIHRSVPTGERGRVQRNEFLEITISSLHV